MSFAQRLPRRMFDGVMFGVGDARLVQCMRAERGVGDGLHHLAAGDGMRGGVE